jgi:hypothetical protein
VCMGDQVFGECQCDCSLYDYFPTIVKMNDYDNFLAIGHTPWVGMAILPAGMDICGYPTPMGTGTGSKSRPWARVANLAHGHATGTKSHPRVLPVTRKIIKAHQKYYNLSNISNSLPPTPSHISSKKGLSV